MVQSAEGVVRAGKPSFESDDEREIHDYQVEHRRGRGLGATAVSSVIFDREREDHAAIFNGA